MHPPAAGHKRPARSRSAPALWAGFLFGETPKCATARERAQYHRSTQLFLAILQLRGTVSKERRLRCGRLNEFRTSIRASI
jgi:hypothetical protein